MRSDGTGQALPATTPSQLDAKSRFRAQGREEAPEEQRWSIQVQCKVEAPSVVGTDWSPSRRAPSQTSGRPTHQHGEPGESYAPPGLPWQGDGCCASGHCCSCPCPAVHASLTPGHRGSVPVPAGSLGAPRGPRSSKRPPSARTSPPGQGRAAGAVGAASPRSAVLGGLAISGGGGGPGESKMMARGSVSCRGAKTWPRGT